MRRGSRAFGWIPRLPIRTVLFLAVGLGVTALGLVAHSTDVLRNVELDSVDARFSIRGTQKPPSELIVVQIDDGQPDLLNLVVEIKGLRGEDAKEKANTIRTYWVPGVNNLGTFGTWAFEEFTDVFAIESDFAALVDSLSLKIAA